MVEHYGILGIESDEVEYFLWWLPIECPDHTRDPGPRGPND